jgi:hypothetical protein
VSDLPSLIYAIRMVAAYACELVISCVYGCFDEFGHNKLLLPVLHGGAVSAFVFIEYSPDTRDGVPMISVGRYFKSND